MTSIASTWGRTVAVALILLVALVTRMENLRQPFDDVFGWREASTAMMARNLPKNQWNPLWPEVDWTGHEPGYQGREFQTLTYVAALADASFGARDWHGRAAAVMFGMLTTISILGLVSTLRNRREGLAAAAIYAIAPGAVMADRSYLPDPAMVSLLTASLWALASGLKRSSGPCLCAAAVLGILSILAKPAAASAIPAAIVMVAFAATAAGRGRLALLMGLWLATAALICGSYFIWTIQLGLKSASGHVAGHWHVPWAEQAAHAFYVRRLSWLASNWLWTPVILLLALVGLFVMLSERWTSGARFFLVWALSLCFVYVGISSEFINNPWNLHVVDPLMSSMAGAGLVRIISVSSTRTALSAAAVVLFAVALDARRNLHDMKFGYPYTAERSLGETLNLLSSPGDLVVVASEYAGNPLAIYYSGRKGWTFPYKGQTVDYAAGHGNAADTLSWMKINGARWFGIMHDAKDYRGRKFVDYHADLMKYLNEEYEEIYSGKKYVIYRIK